MALTEDETIKLKLDGAMGLILSLDDSYIKSFLITGWISLMGEVTGDDIPIEEMAERLSPIADQFLANYRASARAHGVANA